MILLYALAFIIAVWLSIGLGLLAFVGLVIWADNGGHLVPRWMR